jgi:hypothetical protein
MQCAFARRAKRLHGIRPYMVYAMHTHMFTACVHQHETYGYAYTVAKSFRKFQHRYITDAAEENLPVTKIPG